MNILLHNSSTGYTCVTYTCVALYKLITATINNSYNILQNINNKSSIYSSISRIAELDILFNINIIKNLLKDLEYEDNNSIKLTVIGIHELLEKLNIELSIVYELIKEHENKYLYGWRTLDLTTNITHIEKFNDILNNRYTILIDLLKIYHK